MNRYLGMKDVPTPTDKEEPGNVSINFFNLIISETNYLVFLHPVLQFDLDLTDPTAMSFYRTWMAIAIGNTKIYEHVFPDIPRDSVSITKQTRKVETKQNKQKKKKCDK